MSTTESPEDTLLEPCEDCGVDTPHEVDVQVLEMGEGDNRAFSREPYRIAKCTACGAETTTPARCL